MTNEIVPDSSGNKVNYQKCQEYHALVEECRSIIVERSWNAKAELIVGYGEIGQRIYNDPLFSKYGKGNRKFINQLCNDVGLNVKTGYNCIRFYEKYIHNKLSEVSNVLETLPEGKNISWHKIVNFYLSKPTDEELNEVKDIDLPKNIKLTNEDFRTADIDNESVDLILTDPPYPEEYLPLWDDLGKFAEKVLKPSSFLVVYSGQIHVPEIFSILSKYLKYYWTFALYHNGQTQLIMPRNVMCRWKPILVFQKPPFKKLEYISQDYVISELKEKSSHEWQQSESGAKHLIEQFSKQGDFILDPFSGSGTFAKVAYEMGRNAHGIEIDEVTHLTAKRRIILPIKNNQQVRYGDLASHTDNLAN